MGRLTHLIIIQLQIGIALSAGLLKVKFINFTEISKLDCDYISSCDLLFRVCIDEKSGNPENPNECHYFHEYAREFNKNEVVVQFDQWPEAVLLKLIVLDEDLRSYEEVDRLHGYLHLISGNMSEIILKNKTRIVIAYNVACQKNFYGPHCSKYCSVNGSIGSHFICNQELGDIECDEGWTGLMCNMRLIQQTIETKNPNFVLIPDLHMIHSTSTVTVFQEEEKPTLSTHESTLNDSSLSSSTLLEYRSSQLYQDIDFVNEKPVFIKPEQLLSTATSNVSAAGSSSRSNIAIPSDRKELPFKNNIRKLPKYKNLVIGNISEHLNKTNMFTESKEAKTKNDANLNSRKNYQILLNGSVGNLITVIEDALRHEVGDDVAVLLSVNVGVRKGILQYQIYTRNETLPAGVKDLVQKLQPNIDSALAHLITTHHQSSTAKNTSFKRKGIPEWGIVLVIIAMVATAIIAIRQIHKHCGSKNFAKSKHLKEENESPESMSSSINPPLHFINPAYVQP